MNPSAENGLGFGLLKTCKRNLYYYGSNLQTKSMENLQVKILVRKQSKQMNMHKKKLYLTYVEMGHHALAHGSNGLEKWR